MIAKSLDQFAGALSILSAVGGYALWRFEFGDYPHYWSLVETIIFLSCFALSLVLVIAGLRRGNLFSKVCSVCTIGMLLWFAEPVLGVGRMIDNSFRKDEYAFLYTGAPECDIVVPIRDAQEMVKFDETVGRFASEQNIRKCRQKLHMFYSGPPRPDFKGDHVAIWSGIWWSTNATQKTGSILLASYDQAYPVADFKSLEDSLIDQMTMVFSNRAKITFKEAWITGSMNSPAKSPRS